MPTTNLEGRTYRASSGQWAFEVSCGVLPIVGGAGYPTEDEALQALYEEWDAQTMEAR